METRKFSLEELENKQDEGNGCGYFVIGGAILGVIIFGGVGGAVTGALAAGAGCATIVE